MVDIVTRLGAACLAVTFAWAAASKLIRFAHWRAALEPYGLPRSFRSLAAVGVPITEVTVVVLLLAGNVQAGTSLACGLLALFSAALLRARAAQGDRLPCGCFGRTQERDYRVLLLRNALLALLGAVVLTLGVGSDTSIDVATGDLAPVALVLAGIGLIGWMAVQASTAMRNK
ncbi:MAG TPA: MauE/DoxX family redox-associated membrane protein [Actinomycetota bacterium]|nr:MauE/DoxX family redox-associated membrane protein [Actinomycetota bacterium]